MGRCQVGAVIGLRLTLGRLGEGGLCGNKSLPAFAKPVLYEGGISRTTLSSKHIKRKRKNERGKQFNLNKKWEQEI